MGADGTVAAFLGGFDFFFQVCGGLTHPRGSRVHRSLFWAESLEGEKLSDFLGDLSVDDVFGIAIVQYYFLDPFYSIPFKKIIQF